MKILSFVVCTMLVASVAFAETPEERKARLAREDAIRVRLQTLEAEIHQYLHPHKKNHQAEGWELQRQIVTNANFRIGNRMNSIRSMLQGSRSAKVGEKRHITKDGRQITALTYVPLAKEIVAKGAAYADFRDDMRAEILSMVLENEKAAGEGAAARADASAVYAMPGANDTMKTDALKYLVSWELATKGEAAALKLCDREPRCAAASTLAKSWIADECYRFNDGGKILEDAGMWFEAAGYWRNERHPDSKRAYEAYRKVLLDEKAPHGQRIRAYDYVLRDDLELARKYLPMRLGWSKSDTNYAIRSINWQIGTCWQNGRDEPNYYGRWNETVKVLPFIREACAFAKIDVYYDTAFNGVLAMAATGDAKGAAKAATEFGATKSWKPAERYCLSFIGAVIAETGDVKTLAEKVRAADRKLAGDLPPQERVKYIERAGSIAMLANNENLVRALNEVRLALYVPKPKRFYTVKYTETPIEGLNGFEAQLKKADVAKLDRSYGGNMDFLVTDVSTGDRGVGIGTDKAKKAPPPEMRILCDRNGLHFRYDIPEKDQAKILAGEGSAGSFESYIAPGDNEPYTCFMFGLDKKSMSCFGTAYDSPGHRRIRENDRAFCQCDSAVRDGKVVGYYYFSWENWLERLPKNGSEWDFEPLFWNSQGSFAFNGTESIHGRSTWGRLVFDLPEAGRIAILRQALFAAKEHYKLARAARSTAPLGSFCRWEDPEIGDPQFFAKVLAPMEKRLNAGLDLVTSAMKDEDVERLAKTYLSDWWNIEYLVQKARTRYLAVR